jgi:hypothetical protein
MSQVLGAFGLLDFTMLRSVLACRAFCNLFIVYFFNFPIFSGRGKPRILNQWIRGHDCTRKSSPNHCFFCLDEQKLATLCDHGAALTLSTAIARKYASRGLCPFYSKSITVYIQTLRFIPTHRLTINACYFPMDYIQFSVFCTQVFRNQYKEVADATKGSWL